MERRIAASLIVALFVCSACDLLSKGNLPGIAVNVPVYPGAQIGPLEKRTVAGVPSGDQYQVCSVILQTDEPALAVLDFYKQAMTGVRIEDFGAYWAVIHVPETWTAPDRIEIQIPKRRDPSLRGYEVLQFRQR